MEDNELFDFKISFKKIIDYLDSFKILELKEGDKIGFNANDLFYISGGSSVYVPKLFQKTAQVMSRQYYGDGRHSLINVFEFIILKELDEFVQCSGRYLDSTFYTNVNTQDEDGRISRNRNETKFWIECSEEISSKVDDIVDNFGILRETYGDDNNMPNALSSIEKRLLNLIVRFSTIVTMIGSEIDNSESDDEHKLFDTYIESNGIIDITPFNGISLKDIYQRRLCFCSGAKKMLDYVWYGIGTSNSLGTSLHDSYLCLYQQILEDITKLEDSEMEKYMKASKNEIDNITFIKHWTDCNSLQAELTKNIYELFKELYDFVGNYQYNELTGYTKEVMQVISQSKKPKLMSKLFDVFVHTANSEFHRRHLCIQSSFQIRSSYFNEKSVRVNVAEKLYLQDVYQLGEDNDLITFIQNLKLSQSEEWVHYLRSESEPEIIHRSIFDSLSSSTYTTKQTPTPIPPKLNNYILEHRDKLIRILVHKIQFLQNEYRSSSECKNSAVLDPFSKYCLTSNCWRVKLHVSDQIAIPWRFIRSGAFTDFRDSSTNIMDFSPEFNSDQYNERKECLFSTILPLIVEHATIRGEQIILDIETNSPNFNLYTKSIYWTQISLLHTVKKELNMFMDMKWICEQIDGATLIFDGSCGFDPDNEKFVHIPLEINMDGLPLRLTLNVILYNISIFNGEVEQPKDHNKNSMNRSFQRIVEHTKFDAVDYRADERVKNLSHLFEEMLGGNSWSKYQLALELVITELGTGANIGINCKSGKDRTGTLINLLYAKYIHSLFQDMDLWELQNTTMHKGTSLFITGINTFVKAYKLLPQYIQGFTWWETITRIPPTALSSS